MIIQIKYSFVILTLIISTSIFSQIQEKKIEINRIGYSEINRLLGNELAAPKWINAGDFLDQYNDFCIALCDFNLNGIYNEIGIDFIMIGKKGEKYFPISANITCQKIKQVIYLKSDQLFYKVNYIDPNGKYVKICPTEEQNSNYIKKFDKLPVLNYVDIDGNDKSFKEFAEIKNYIYIEIWWENCPPCIEALPLLNELSEKYKNSITILNLLDKGDLNDLKRLTQKYNLKLLQGLSNLEINNELLLFGYPHGLLFDKDGNLLKFKMSIKELQEFLGKINNGTNF